MNARRRLPNRRASIVFDIEVNGLRFTCTASRYVDRAIGEIFITNHKAGSTAGIMASDAAIAASLAFQFGCPLETLRHALSRDANGKATSPLGAALDIVAGQP
jgi:hypothetical protein